MKKTEPEASRGPRFFTLHLHYRHYYHYPQTPLLQGERSWLVKFHRRAQVKKRGPLPAWLPQKQESLSHKPLITPFTYIALSHITTVKADISKNRDFVIKLV